MSALDPALIHALNVRLVDHDEIGTSPADHAVVQVSTIAAVLDRQYDGDASFF